MTLDTRVYILSRIDHRELFVKCNQLIGAHEHVEFTDEQMDDGEWSIWNTPGQGLCALLDITYRPDAPLHEGASHWDDCEPDCDYPPHVLPRWADVSFDTAYSYREGNEGCGDLHARLVAQLGQWLDSKNIRWQWQNEFTGEIHSGYDRLADLCSGGAEATSWYRTVAAPAIAAHIAGGAS